MDLKKSAFLSLLGIAVLLVSIVLGTPGKGNAAPPGDRDVRVINSASEAVPVTGSLTLAGTPGVVVTNAPDVVVTNSAANPILVRDVDRPAAQTFARDVFQTIPAGSQFTTTSLMTVTVPVGKRFVIETFSCQISTVGPQTLLASFVTRTNNHVTEYFVPVTATPFDTSLYFVGTLPVKAYADSGTDLWAYIRLGTAGAAASVRCTFAGYLVDLP